MTTASVVDAVKNVCKSGNFSGVIKWLFVTFNDVCLFAEQPAAVQYHTVLRNDKNHVVSADRVQLSSDIESSSLTDDSDVDVVTRSDRNSKQRTTVWALEHYCS